MNTITIIRQVSFVVRKKSLMRKRIEHVALFLCVTGLTGILVNLDGKVPMLSQIGFFELVISAVLFLGLTFTTPAP